MGMVARWTLGLLLLAAAVGAQSPSDTAKHEDPPTASRADGTAAAPIAPKQPATPQEPSDKRVFGVQPNYRTANETAIYTPITARQKFTIARKDTFDYPLVFLAAGFAGLGQAADQHPQFGQGMQGYMKRLGTSYLDQVTGNMMTEGVLPALLHEDPRYFRRGVGTKGSRTRYALTRIFVTRTDSGGRRFNYSEVFGNATSVAISNIYYADGRSARDNVVKLAGQLGTDAASQVLKEFWPDIKHRFFRGNKEDNP